MKNSRLMSRMLAFALVLVALWSCDDYETYGERATMTLETVGTIDTVIVKGVNGTLYQFYQVK